MRQIFIVLISSLFLFAVQARGESPFEGVKSDWKGFARTDFKFAGKSCYVVEPERAAEGRPWVWRARFPGYHDEIDRLLLADGYRVAHIDTGGMLGSPAALGLWEAFYERMTSVHGLNPKVVMEGVSRGGLFLYRFAKAHPESVACIYCDTPVCDFKSWPGGKGKGIGAEGMWKKLFKEYGFADEAEAMAYADLPIDNLQPIVDARIPIMHIVTEDDRVVPPAENTYVLKARLEELGLPFFYVNSLAKGARLHGHHFDLRHPEIGYHFIRKYSNFASEHPVYLRGGLKNAQHVFTSSKKGRVAFLGGSITEMAGWRDHVAESLQRRFPDTEFDFVFAGIGSTDSTMGAFRLHRDIFSRGRVDLLFIESAVNELHNGRTRTEITRAVEGIILNARRHNPAIDIVAQYLYDMPYVERYREGRTPWQIAALERIAIQYGINAIDQARRTTTLFDSGTITPKEFGGCHAKPPGHLAYAEMIDLLFDEAWAGEPPEDVTAHGGSRRYDRFSFDRGHFQPLSSAELGEGWRLVEDWQPASGKARPGDLGATYLQALAPGAELSVRFSGTAIGLPMVAGPDVGVIEWQIDDGEWKSLDQFTKWSRGLHIPWIHMLETELADGPHLLRLRTTDRKNPQSTGHACRFRYFAVNGEAEGERAPGAR